MLVVGGAGFLGAHVVRMLVSRGYPVRVLDDGSTGRWERLAQLSPEWIEVVRGDVRNVASVEESVRGVRAVVHTAGRPVDDERDDSRLAHDVNVTGSLNVVSAALRERVQRFVYLSTSAVYGLREASLLHEDLPIDPRSHHGTEAAFVEHHLRTCATLHSFPAVILRVFAAYGPFEHPSSPAAGLVARLASAVLSRRPPIMHGDGSQSFDLVHADDVATATVSALELPNAVGGTFNVGGGECVTVMTLYDLLCSLGGLGADRPAPRFAPPLRFERRATQAALGRACRELRFVPRVRLREGLLRTIEHLRACVPPPVPCAGRARFPPPSSREAANDDFARALLQDDGMAVAPGLDATDAMDLQELKT